jgi:hypothetical protein
MLVVLRFTVDDTEEFLGVARPGLTALAACPGYEGGQLARAYDEPGIWCLAMRWASVGAYRRALGSYDVKAHATPLLSRALPEPSAFEPLLTAAPGETPRAGRSDLAAPPPGTTGR